MNSYSNNSYSQLDTVFRHADKILSNLLANVKNTAKLMRYLGDLRELIGSVPFGTVDYDLTVARINNAQRYLESNEAGAAKYEIRQLVLRLNGLIPPSRSGDNRMDSVLPMQNAPTSSLLQTTD